MTNKVYTYNKISKTMNNQNIKVSDFTEFYNFGEEILNVYSDYFDTVAINNDEKFENISYILYKDENNADLISFVNTIDLLWSSPYNQNVINTKFDEVMRYLNRNIKLDNDNISNLLPIRDDIYDKIDETNSNKRFIKVPKSDKVSELLNKIDEYKNNPTIFEEN